MNFKKLIALLLTISMMLVLFACGGNDVPDEPVTPDEDEKIEYEVWVKNNRGEPVKGVSVQLFLDGIVPVGKAALTEDDGRVVFELDEGNYSAKIMSVPDGYGTVDGAFALVDESVEITVPNYPEYTVRVVDLYGAPIEGVQVQLCSDTGCQFPKATDADGKVVFKYVEDNYKALVLEAEGYIVTDEYFPLENNEVTIILEKE